MKTSSWQLRSRKKARENRAADQAREMKGAVVLMHYRGKCKCGALLTDRDKNRGKTTFTCPCCGKSGHLVRTPQSPAETEGKTV